ncbi:hypothetical protein O7634_01495 [Micromonospora sp. WMMD1120]|uniref:hypothetical protein n=1 Tax=Micromonospora sp. WMMD1120 TaxID=3016106 RepID=UPI002417CE78|nr:hypothetical protein [Micromonospora sp. WMMD1120]MDG4805433.1 hypothetical protein [Micromonospora sp. WMMD1120]
MGTTGGRPRRGATIGVALAVLALSAPAATATAASHPSTTAADRTAAASVPTAAHNPWLWQATVGQRPAGPAALVFFTPRTRYFESTGVLVGRDGGYRLIPLRVGEGHGLVSPDGRHYLRPQTGELLDLTTGRQRRAMTDGVSLFDWSPDGRRVLGTRSNDDDVISFGPDNQQLNDPEKPDDLLVVDPYRGTEQVVAAGVFAAHHGAAWSSTGDLVAVAGPPDEPALLAERQRLVVVDPNGGGPRWHLDLGDRRMLAGPAAWHPDNGRIALLAFDGCAGPRCAVEQIEARRWRIEFVDATSGRAVGQPLPLAAGVNSIVGWRGADPVVRHVSGTEADTDRRATLAVLSDGGAREVLVTGPPGSTDLAVPGDLLRRYAFGGPERRPSPFAAPLWCYLALAAPVLLAVVLVLRRVRRRRGSATTPTTTPAPWT